MAFFGKRTVIEKMLVALLCSGHVLLEDIPGVGKTILARAIAVSLGGKFARIQCTPDLLPADVLGVSIFNPKDREFEFRQGPIMSHIILIDEINRATPRTQSALLEAMAENQISIEGRQLLLPEPFFLIATENPVEFEGTFPLPEAQKDRFLLCLNIGYPSRETELKIIESQNRTTHPIIDLKSVTNIDIIKQLKEYVVSIHVEESVCHYIMDIIHATREHQQLSLGVSPRGLLALYKSSQALAALRGRDYVIPEDVKELVIPVLAKRIIIKSEHLIKGVTSDFILNSILDQVPVPVLRDHV